MLVHEQSKIHIDSICMMEKKHDPDTYIVRIVAGAGRFIDSPEMPAQEALRLYKELYIDERYE